MLAPAVLLLCCVAAALLVPHSPLAHLGEPTYGAALAMPVVLAVLLALRITRRERAERAVFALFLASMPLVYVQSWVRSPVPGWLGIELAGLLLFAVVAVLSLWRWPWLLPAGILAHGLLWDAWHYRRTPYMPDWYSLACALVDIGLAVYVASRIRQWQLDTNGAARAAAPAADAGLPGAAP